MTIESLSLWWSLNGPGDPLEPLAGDHDCDVAIVGGGFTGLWTAYYLAQADPRLSITVIEKERVGFGASGRNGGWCSALFPAGPHRIASEFNRAAAIDMYTTMHEVVDEVGRVVAQHDIACGWRKGGTVHTARTAPQLARAHEEIAEWREFGFGEADYRFLDRQEAAAMVSAEGVLGGAYTPHCAAIDPLALLRGLLTAVLEAGVTVVEGTAATSIEPGRVTTERGVVTARHVIRATEAYTSQLGGGVRAIAPIYSLVIATEPLPDEIWRTIGLADGQTFNDLRHMIIYGQRTHDNRIAFGGRGAPYHFRSKIDPAFDRDDSVHEALRETLEMMFPVLTGVEITHRWGGPLGVARDWWAGVEYDPKTGVGAAGGYVGDGVGTSNLAGRTLADLITGADTKLTSLPWVNRRRRRWEPEPLRWVGANAALLAMYGADANERRSGKPSRIADGINQLLRG